MARKDRRKWLRWSSVALVAALVVGVVVMAWVPDPVRVEVAEVSRGKLRVTVNEDGTTRVKDRYVVSAPIAGNLSRLELEAGDTVKQGQVLSRLVPLPPPLLDARARTAAKAQVDAASAAKRQARAAVSRAQVALELAKKEATRARAVVSQGGLSRSEADRAEAALRRNQEDLTSAHFGARVAEHELALARTALLRLTGKSEEGEQLEIVSPVDGQVLRVFQESEGVLQGGAPILEIGDPGALEVVVDVLSEDATAIRPGAKTHIERWGGSSGLEAHVRVVEPSAFTKVSALGVEEQRVNVVIDIDAPREEWPTLGDGYRVEARVVVWEADSVLRVPASAVFRLGEAWAAYVVDEKRARLREVELGKTNGLHTELLDGLAEGDTVVAYPSDSVSDGTRLKPQQERR